MHDFFYIDVDMYELVLFHLPALYCFGGWCVWGMRACMCVCVCVVEEGSTEDTVEQYFFAVVYGQY
jgi:hypothetical protein